MVEWFQSQLHIYNLYDMQNNLAQYLRVISPAGQGRRVPSGRGFHTTDWVICACFDSGFGVPRVTARPELLPHI